MNNKSPALAFIKDAEIIIEEARFSFTKGHWHREPSFYGSFNGTAASLLFDQDDAEEALKNLEWVVAKIKSVII